MVKTETTSPAPTLTAPARRHAQPNPYDAAEALEGDDDGAIAYAASVLDEGMLARNVDGDAAGVVYRDQGTGRWYAADVDDVRDLLTRIADREADASLWCADTTAEERESAEAAAADLV